ncbi:MAG TPA: Asp-tRNA(Asn)/Glu-tRNA(Gln) amidotransferase subunit GatC [Candidatus Jorgensenbacteria bacterium]|nr:Asp-tRNA(Asn)/Glu-tRNA(Gln) amidotransferase subunit GatC [Candidatus Jorgensenbacteria bacterium]
MGNIMDKKLVINKTLLHHLAKLARIDLGEEEAQLLKDFRAIISYFDELSELDTSSVEPMSGGTDLENVFRDDVYEEEKRLPQDGARDALPKKEGDYLSVPPVL